MQTIKGNNHHHQISDDVVGAASKATSRTFIICVKVVFLCKDNGIA
jgi:hypothetical protein